MWKEQWIVAIHKRNAVSDPNNYRGVHLTTLLSKVAERAVCEPMMEFLRLSDVWGDSQFACRKEHSSKDVLAFVACTWLLALDVGNKVGVYCSDIKGAFDRVSLEKLLAKCSSYGLPEKAPPALRNPSKVISSSLDFLRRRSNA